MFILFKILSIKGKLPKANFQDKFFLQAFCQYQSFCIYSLSNGDFWVIHDNFTVLRVNNGRSKTFVLPE